MQRYWYKFQVNESKLSISRVSVGSSRIGGGGWTVSELDVIAMMDEADVPEE
jgi:hypothetical protein